MRLYFWPSLRYVPSRATGPLENVAFIKTFPLTALLIMMAVLFFGASAVHAASNINIKGRVHDGVTGLPVIAATIILDNTDYTTLSDNLGRFELKNVPLGKYTVAVSSVGYKTRRIENVEVVSDITAHVEADLEPIVYTLPPVKVQGKRIKVSDVGATVIDKCAIDESHATSLADFLADIDGLQVESSGAAGTRSEVKIRGAASDDVLVLLDGQRINGPSDGTADLNSIPLDMVERIEIIKGGASAIYGPDALSGAVNIITQGSNLAKTSSVALERNWSSWNGDGYKAGLESHFLDRKLAVRAMWAGSKSYGSFPFTYIVQPENKVYPGIRDNNGYDKYNYFLSGQYKLGEHKTIGFSGQSYRDRHGLPGAASQPSLTAHATDRRLMSTITFDVGGNNAKGARMTAGFTRLEQSYIEPDLDLPPAVRFDNRYINDIYDLNLLWKTMLPGRMETQTGAQWRHEILDHEDFQIPRFSMNRSTRNNLGLYLSASRTSSLPLDKILDFMSASATVRYDLTHTIKDSTSVRDTVTTNGTEYLSPRFTLAFGKKAGLAYTFSGSWGRSLKVPPINALFWQGDALSGGNPGLKPEKSEQFEVGLKSEYEYKIIRVSMGMTFFDARVEDIIVWMPLYGGWRPVNRNSARITGHDDFAVVALFNNRLEINYKNTATNPFNKTPGHNSYDNDLPFSPRYVTSYSVKFDLDYIYGSYIIRQSGRAFTNEAATKYYDAYRIHNVRFGGKCEFKKYWVLNLDFNFDNINDENYVLIAHYPMPGYSWGISCGIKYTPK